MLSHSQIVFLGLNSGLPRISLVFLYISKSQRTHESQARSCHLEFKPYDSGVPSTVSMMFSNSRLSAGEVLYLHECQCTCWKLQRDALWACFVCSPSQLPAEPRLCKSTVVGGLRSSLMAFPIPSLWETSLWMGSASTSAPPRLLRSHEEWWPWREYEGMGEDWEIIRARRRE